MRLPEGDREARGPEAKRIDRFGPDELAPFARRNDIDVQTHPTRELVGLADVWRAAGSPPNMRLVDWLRLPSTKELRAQLAQTESGKSRLGPFAERGGIAQDNSWGV